MCFTCQEQVPGSRKERQGQVRGSRKEWQKRVRESRKECRRVETSGIIQHSNLKPQPYPKENKRRATNWAD
jgi:ribosomal protein L19E